MRPTFLFLTLFATVAVANAQDAPAEKTEFKTNREKVSYAIGMNIGRQFQSQGMDLDPKIVAMGIAAILENTEPALTQVEIQAAFEALQADMQKAREALADTNKEAAKKFLTENATKKGIQKTKSGLQYIVLQEGEGKSPTEKSTVSTHYRGKLLNGKVFDQSYEGDAPTDADEPVSFGVTQVIPGWTEALQLMKVGSKYRLFIPPELAYGLQAPASIGPNSLLIFDIELIAVK